MACRARLERPRDPCRLLRFSRCSGRGSFRGSLVCLLRGDASLAAADGGMMATHDGAHGLAEIAQQMPAIGDVDGPGCTASGAVGIDVGPVAGDHLHAGVTAQPFGEGAGVPIGQEIDDGPARAGRPGAVRTGCGSDLTAGGSWGSRPWAGGPWRRW